MNDEFDGFGMVIMGEDEFMLPDDIPAMPPNLTSGRNIKTGCYGLFLVALDQCDNPLDKTILDLAKDWIEDIHGCVVFNAMALHYPPDDLSYKTIVKLARCILMLHDEASGVHAGEIPYQTILRIENAIVDTLGLRDAIMPIKDIIHHHLNSPPIQMEDDNENDIPARDS